MRIAGFLDRRFAFGSFIFIGILCALIYAERCMDDCSDLFLDRARVVFAVIREIGRIDGCYLKDAHIGAAKIAELGAGILCDA